MCGERDTPPLSGAQSRRDLLHSDVLVNPAPSQPGHTAAVSRRFTAARVALASPGRNS